MKEVSPFWIFNLSKEGVTYIVSLSQHRSYWSPDPPAAALQNQRNSIHWDSEWTRARSWKQGHLRVGQWISKVTLLLRGCDVCLAGPRCPDWHPLSSCYRTGGMWPMHLGDTEDSGTVSVGDVIYRSAGHPASWLSGCCDVCQRNNRRQLSETWVLTGVWSN